MEKRIEGKQVERVQGKGIVMAAVFLQVLSQLYSSSLILWTDPNQIPLPNPPTLILSRTDFISIA
jgi:hypothetical protein